MHKIAKNIAAVMCDHINEFGMLSKQNYTFDKNVYFTKGDRGMNIHI